MGIKKSEDHLVWVDMEMTGLDPEKERIIEIATIVTKNDLEIIAEGPDLVIHQSEEILEAMGSWNQKQHKKSGLLEEVRNSKMTVRKAETLTLNFIRRYCLPGKSLLCGNAVHHDRRFMIKYMPRLHGFLHYRHIDVSSVKELAKRWYLKDPNQPKKKNGHRALSDIRESIEELRYYRQRYFRPFSEVK